MWPPAGSERPAWQCPLRVQRCKNPKSHPTPSIDFQDFVHPSRELVQHTGEVSSLPQASEHLGCIRKSPQTKTNRYPQIMDSPIRVYETWWKINEQIIKAQLKSSIGDLSTGWHHREKILRDGDRSGWTPRSVPTRSLSFRPVELTSAPGLYNMVVLSKLVGGFNHLEKYESQREGLSWWICPERT